MTAPEPAPRQPYGHNLGARPDERASQLEQALANRSTIYQALGVMMSQNRCSRDAAMGILRRASQDRNIKLREVAATIIERFTDHPASDPLPAADSPNITAQVCGEAVARLAESLALSRHALSRPTTSAQLHRRFDSFAAPSIIGSWIQQ